MTFGQRLRELRVARHIRQAELAKQVGMSPSSISMYEADQRLPSFEIEEKLADFFNVDLNYLRGKVDSTTEIVSSEVHVLIQVIKRMTPRQRSLVIAYAKGIVDFEEALKQEEIETEQLISGDQMTIDNCFQSVENQVDNSSENDETDPETSNTDEVSSYNQDQPGL